MNYFDENSEKFMTETHKLTEYLDFNIQSNFL